MDNHSDTYFLDEQIGFVLRRVTQRHLAIFSDAIPGVTTTQFAALAKLVELGPMSQNQLGRVTAMDAATIKGVVDRLGREDLVATQPDEVDRRRLTVSPTEQGLALYDRIWQDALEVSQRTLEPLSANERRQLMRLLKKLV